jgi:hypothetical protein
VLHPNAHAARHWGKIARPRLALPSRGFVNFSDPLVLSQFEIESWGRDVVTRYFSAVAGLAYVGLELSNSLGRNHHLGRDCRCSVCCTRRISCRLSFVRGEEAQEERNRSPEALKARSGLPRWGKSAAPGQAPSRQIFAGSLVPVFAIVLVEDWGSNCATRCATGFDVLSRRCMIASLDQRVTAP